MEAINFLTQVLGSPFGSFAFVFGLMLFAGWLIYWVTKNITVINTEHGAAKQMTEKLDTYIDELRKDMAFVKGTLEIMKNQNGDLAQAHSPISLTDKGKHLASENHLQEMVAANWSRIISVIDAKVKNKNAYDIQQFCIETMAVEPEVLLPETDILILKQQAYNIGKLLQEYSIIPALIIRDRYFQEKHIEMADVDKYDPTKQM